MKTIALLITLLCSWSYAVAGSYAEIDENGTVLRVVACDSREWLETTLGGVWVETFKNDAAKNFAGPGMSYDASRKCFHGPRPFDSWLLNDKGDWVAPITSPDIQLPDQVRWDEPQRKWEVIRSTK